MVKLFAAVSTLLCASLAAAQLTITNPNANSWWVAKSQNVLEWTCKTSPQAQFTVLITNQDKSKYPSPLAFIAIQDNFQCSVIITQDQANQPAGTGWQILFANPLNNTDVYASSDPFEIKPLGSAYPSQVSASANAPGGSGAGAVTGGTGTQSSSTPVKTGGASNIQVLGMGSVAAVALGLAALMA